MKTIPSLSAAAAALLCSAATWATPTVLILPAVQTVAQGATVNVTVSISNLGGEIASAFDLDVLYDTTKLTFVGSSFLAQSQFGGTDPVFGDNFSFDTTGSTPGDANAVGYSLLDDPDLVPLQTDGFDLYSLTFTAANVDDITNLTFGSNPSYSPFVLTFNASPLPLQFAGACVAIGAGDCSPVNPAPEPASYGLAAIALLAAGVAGRKRRRAGLGAVPA